MSFINLNNDCSKREINQYEGSADSTANFPGVAGGTNEHLEAKEHDQLYISDGVLKGKFYIHNGTEWIEQGV